MYSSLGAEELTTHKQPQAEKRQSLLSLAKGAGKGQLNRTENFQTVTILLQPNTSEKTGLTYHARSKG